MADLAVGLAKWVVEGTLSKARAAIGEEAKLRDSAQRDLVFITDEFQMMQSFLEMANAERIENKVVLTWVRQIRELAYDVEDCVEFVVHLDNKPSWWFRMIPSCIAPALPLDEAVHDIERLKARVADVSTRNTRYSLISDTGSKPTATVQQEQPASDAAVGPNMLIGTGTRKQQDGDLTRLLFNTNGHLRVISVWGRGGDLGVTSIIWKAYNDQEIHQNFPCRAWVKVMHPFNPGEFVRSLMDQFYANTTNGQEEEIIGLDVLERTSSTSGAAHLQEFARQIKEERYLIVLEDLSTITDWNAITKFFPARKNGSCIIVSTKHSEVASLSVGHPYQVLDLNHFSIDHSVYALYNEGYQCDRDKGQDNASRNSDKNKAAEEWMMMNILVGREPEMNELRQYTTKACFDSIQVMSVWGIAGVGKSAVVKNLFCDRILNKQNPDQRKRRNLFDKYGWVDVSHPFNLRDFARRLLLNLHSESLQETTHYEMMGQKNPILECKYILKQHRCLVVIDGLKSTKEWDLIQEDIVSGSSRNCIIAITTEASIAKHCLGDKGELMFNVKGLEPDSAFHLFEKEISSMYPLPHTLACSEVAELQELISKCGGLPKVIVDIARSLATKAVGRMQAVRSINNNFMHALENNPEFDSLHGLFAWMHSYFRTWDSLKPCIFYLSLFPRDRIIRRRRIVRRWIAEGYSRDNHEESAEHIGEKQFSGMLDLNIIQPPQQTTAIGGTRMVLYQVNGFIREFFFKRRMDENHAVELGENCIITTQRTGRHLVILEEWDRDIIVFESMDFSRLRSLTVFGNWESFFISESMKLLRVLDLEDASGRVVYEDLKKIVKFLRRLKFLSLRGHREINRLPSSLGHLRQLQTLDVRHTSIVTLPESITKLQKLQYIRAGAIDVPVSAPPPSISSRWFCRRRRLVGVVVPSGIGKLTALHTLGVVNVAASGSKTSVKDLKKLTQLRKLGVSGINRKNSKEFFSAIEGHVHLESLSVQLDRETQGCLDDMISLPCKNLRSLKLHGLDEALPEWGSNQLSKLAKLDLEMATLPEIDMKFLGGLPELCILRVKQLQDGELQFRVIVDGEEEYSFGKVKVLQIACGGSSSSLHVTFGSDAMRKLELLNVNCYGGSPPYQFSGLENLRELKQVLLLNGFHAQALQEQLQSQLAEHPNKPVLMLEEDLRLS